MITRVVAQYIVMVTRRDGDNWPDLTDREQDVTIRPLQLTINFGQDVSAEETTDLEIADLIIATGTNVNNPEHGGAGWSVDIDPEDLPWPDLDVIIKEARNLLPRWETKEAP